MLVQRKEGQLQPGWQWGPFTFRLPFYHTRFELPEFLQGLLVSAATGLAIVPVMVGMLGLTFEEAVFMAFLHAVLISSAPIVFGEPFAPGWITPALPLVLAYIATEYAGETERIQAMTAMSLDFAVILFALGMTGLGRKLIEWIPVALKGAIIMGAAIAALIRVFMWADPLPSGNIYEMPVTIGAALVACLFLTFALPVQLNKARIPWLNKLASLGLLPGFILAAIVGVLPFVNEFSYDVQFGEYYGLLIPPVASLFEKVSPFAIGWPSMTMFINSLPLAFIAYIILFGDIVTGIEVLKTGIPKRPDEQIDFNSNRTHISTGARNVLMALFAPFFPTQGSLWTGVHVIIVNRWAEGRHAMDSLFGGIASYYFFGVPLLYLCLPLVTGLQPLMPVALALTLVLTGFACAYVAMDIPRNPVERGVVLLGGVALALFDAWIGLLIAIAATVLLVGRAAHHQPEAESPTQPSPPHKHPADADGLPVPPDREQAAKERERVEA